MVQYDLDVKEKGEKRVLICYEQHKKNKNVVKEIVCYCQACRQKTKCSL